MSSGIIGGNAFSIHVITASVNIASTATNTTTETDVTVTGVKVGDIVIGSKPTHSTGLGITNYRVKADDTVSIQAMNTTGSTIDPAAETYTFVVLRPEGGTPKTKIGW